MLGNITFYKIKVLLLSIIAYVYKYAVDFKLLKIPRLEGDCDFVVSVTSYGRRVSKSIVYYTLISILRQSVQPSRIILWLAEDEWTEDTLPLKLTKLKAKGVEIRYCKDLRSYKKLIPTLLICKDSNIVTVDDDTIYNKNFIKELFDEHRKYPKSIICRHASLPIIEKGVPTRYKEWNEIYIYSKGRLLFPVGAGGILYPVNSLHDDVTNDRLFMNLCPFADDIWFWFCGLRKQTNKIFIKPNHADVSIDMIYQYFHKGSALTHSNRFEHANDVQFKNLFKHYNVVVNEDGNLISCT